MAKQFVIIHGLGGSGPEHWQSWLASELRSQGEKVYYPELPTPSTPKCDEWIAALEKEISSFDPSDELIVLLHSLSPVCWVHFEKLHPKVIAKKVYMVAPVVTYPNVEEVESFFPVPEFQPHPETEYTVIGSENDPWIPLKDMKDFAETYDFPFIYLEGQGHINVAAGYGEWPWILEECVG